MTNDPSPELERRKRQEALWLATGFKLVFVLFVIDLIARNIGPWRPFWGFYVTWEAASILFAMIVTPMYWKKYISRGNQTAYSAVFETDNNRVVGLAVLVGFSMISLVVAGLLAIFIAYNQYDEAFNLEIMLVAETGCLVLGMLLLVFAEMMVISAVPKALAKAEEALIKQRNLLDNVNSNGRETVLEELEMRERRVADYRDMIDDLGKVLAFSDAPITLAFGTIFFLVCAHALGMLGDGIGNIPPFIAGAVAFQLLYSNFVFYLEANGSFPEWARKKIPLLDSLTPMIQGKSANVGKDIYTGTIQIEKE